MKRAKGAALVATMSVLMQVIQSAIQESTLVEMVFLVRSYGNWSIIAIPRSPSRTHCLHTFLPAYVTGLRRSLWNQFYTHWTFVAFHLHGRRPHHGWVRRSSGIFLEHSTWSVSLFTTIEMGRALQSLQNCISYITADCLQQLLLLPLLLLLALRLQHLVLPPGPLQGDRRPGCRCCKTFRN